MSDTLTIPATGDRAHKREALLPQLKALLEGETDLIAAMANTTAALHDTFGWHWVGFYRAIDGELVLGPFQGPVACARIGFGKGVCGTAWKEDRTQLVPDVDLFPGHIACSALSRSEVVVPLRDRAGNVRGVLDIDSAELNDFTVDDARFIETVGKLVEPLF